MPTLGFLKKKRTREGNSDPSSTSQPTSPVTPTAQKLFDQGSSIPAGGSYSTAASSAPSTSGAAGSPQQTSEKAGMHPALHQTAAFTPPAHTPSPGTDSQNLPSISNLINPTQHDGASHQYTTQQQPQSRFAPPPINNGAAIQQQQQQAMSPPQVPAVQDQPRVTKGKYSLADFEIQRTLGTGSFGRVHLVQSRHNQRYYAVKVLKKAQVVKMKQVEHTNDERRMLGEVKHPFLITLWGTFQDPKNLYMVMDFVEGGELFSLLRKSGVSKPQAAKQSGYG